MTPQELTLLSALLFLLTVIVSFLIQVWRRRRAIHGSPNAAGLDWYAITAYAITAVKDAEQLWLKEGLPKERRLDHALSILLEACPPLANYKSLAAAFIREVIFNMNETRQGSKPSAPPQVLPLPDATLFKQ